MSNIEQQTNTQEIKYIQSNIQPYSLLVSRNQRKKILTQSKFCFHASDYWNKNGPQL